MYHKGIFIFLIYQVFSRIFIQEKILLSDKNSTDRINIYLHHFIKEVQISAYDCQQMIISLLINTLYNSH